VGRADRWTVADQREVAPGRWRSLLRFHDRARRGVCWYVAEVDRIVDCGSNWARAASLLAGAELPARR